VEQLPPKRKSLSVTIEIRISLLWLSPMNNIGHLENIAKQGYSTFKYKFIKRTDTQTQEN